MLTHSNSPLTRINMLLNRHQTEQQQEKQEETAVELHPYQQISQLIARYSENRNMANHHSNKPVINASLWHGLLQKELRDRFNNSPRTSSANINDTNNSGSNLINSRGVIR